MFRRPIFSRVFFMSFAHPFTRDSSYDFLRVLFLSVKPNISFNLSFRDCLWTNHFDSRFLNFVVNYLGPFQILLALIDHLPKLKSLVSSLEVKGWLSPNTKNSGRLARKILKSRAQNGSLFYSFIDTERLGYFLIRIYVC